MQYPRVIMQAELTNEDRAAIMGGKPRRQQNSPATGAAMTIRFVQTGERRGFPIVALEEAGENDAMGNPCWRICDLPWEIVASLLAQHFSLLDISIKHQHQTRFDHEQSARLDPEKALNRPSFASVRIGLREPPIR